MKDLIERLKLCANGFWDRSHPLGDYGICDEAAAALIAQAARIAELEAQIADLPTIAYMAGAADQRDADRRAKALAELAENDAGLLE